MKVYKENGLYLIKEYSETSLFSKNIDNNDLITWHQRFGHVNFTDIRRLIKENIVNGISHSYKDSDIKCVICSKGKMTQLPYQRSESKTNDLLEIVHSDICGPFSTASLGGSKYFVTFIDDKSRYIEVKFLKNRHEVFEAFKNYQLRVERATGMKIKNIRTDNAREYLSTEFKKYLECMGIRHQLSVEYTPQQNGTAERANRTLVEMARCMMIEAEVPESLWAEAVSTAVFIRNRCPSQAIENKSPYEIWHGRKPYVGFFKVFGSRAVMLDKRPGKSKFSSKGKELILVGYENDSKAYRLWDPSTGKIFKSRDVKVFEKRNIKDYLWLEMNEKKISIFEHQTDYSMEEEKERLQKNNEQFNDTVDTNISSSNESSKPFLGFSDNDDESYESAESQNQTTSQPEDDDQMKTPEKSKNDDGTETVKKRRRGRPKILRTGEKGRPRKIYNEEANLTTEIENYPENFEDAMNRYDKEKWINAMNAEIESLRKNKTWELVDRPVNTKVLSNRWVFTVKTKADGSVEKYKARLVVRGCEQRDNVDYGEIYAPVVRYETIRTIFAACAQRKMHLHHMDVITAFVQGDLTDELYMEQPMYPSKDRKNNNNEKVCKLLKPLYGLKQASRQWYLKLSEFLKSLNMKQSDADQCLYVLEQDSKILIITAYVDDLLLASDSLCLLENFKKKLADKFEMKDLGEVSNILGISISRNSSTGNIEISQQKYIEKILKTFNMTDAKAVYTPIEVNLESIRNLVPTSDEAKRMSNRPYRELIGSLIYLSNISRPDITYAVNMLSRFSNDPSETHWKMAKRILRYLKGTINYKIIYSRDEKPLFCYADSDWGADRSDRKSWSGYVTFLAGGPISWKTKKQKSVALSTMEAEYMSLSDATKEVIFLRNLIKDMRMNEFIKQPTFILCDNQSAINFTKTPFHHDRSKHVDIRFHFCREKREEGVIDVSYVPTEKMVADIFTKPLPKIKHYNCVSMLGLIKD